MHVKQEIQSRLRTFRTMQELVIDAQAWIRVPWTTFGKQSKKHPDYPKRPLTPYFRFYHKKLPIYSAQHPGETVSSLAQMISADFAQISEKKVRHYKKAYDREMEEYRKAVQEFIRTHPEAAELANKNKRKDGTAPIKPQTPLMFFVHTKLEGQGFKNAEARKAATEALKEKWKTTKGKKKLKYIKMTLADKERYLGEAEYYKQTCPQYKVDLKRLLTKEEQAIKDKYDGKPKKPPMTGYQLFVRSMASNNELMGIEVGKRNQFLGEMWRTMPDHEKEDFNNEVLREVLKYKEQYDQYLSSLPENERQQQKEDSAEKKFTSSAQKKRLSELESLAQDSEVATKAYNVFQTELMKSPSMKSLPADELMKKTFDQWNEMPLLKKDPYFRAVQKDDSVSLSLSVAETEIIENLKKTQPKKPPRSGYSIFSSQAIAKWQSLVDTKARMGKVAEEWKTLSAAKKEKFTKQYREAFAKYKKEMEQFKAKLDPHELHLFQTFVENKTKKKLQNTLRTAIQNNKSAGSPVAKRKRMTRSKSAADAVPSSQSSSQSGSPAKKSRTKAIAAPANDEEEDGSEASDGGSNEEFVDAVADPDDDEDEDDSDSD